jgi:hypothetical protein
MNSNDSQTRNVRMSAEAFRRLVTAAQDALREGALAFQVNLQTDDGTTVQLMVEADDE